MSVPGLSGVQLPRNWVALAGFLLPSFVAVALGLAQLLLDLAGDHPDPVLSDGFKLALGAALASFAVARHVPGLTNGGKG